LKINHNKFIFRKEKSLERNLENGNIKPLLDRYATLENGAFWTKKY